MMFAEPMQVSFEIGLLKLNFLIFGNACVDPVVSSIPHNHANYELHCIVSGRCSFTINDQTYDVQPGDLLLIPPQEYHGLMTGTSLSNFSQYTFFFHLDAPSTPDEKLAHQAFSEFVLQNRHIRNASSKIQDYCTRLNEEAKCQSLDSINARSAFCSLILIEILRSGQGPMEKIYKNQTIQYGNCSPNNIEDFFNNNYASNIKIQDLANYLNFSIRHTNTILNKFFGMSFTQKLIQKRLSVAKNQLTYSEKTIAEICYDCGFQSHSFFNSCFRKKFGTNPSEFRKNNRKRQLDKTFVKDLSSK